MSRSERGRGAMPLSLMARVDRACDAFEDAWRAGGRPRLEEFLVDPAEPDRSAMLRELLAAELELRRASGERPTPDEYARRFPGQETLIAEVWSGSTAARADPTRTATQVWAPGPGGTAAAGPTGLIAAGPPAGDGPGNGPRGDGPAAGRYRRLAPHARGGLGEVFLAHDAELNREVALKQILDRHADDPASRSRFLLEAEITGGLEHPGIVPVYGLGHDADGRPYYAMRFIRGESLKEAIGQLPRRRAPGATRGGGRWSCASCLRRFLDVCNAIDYAHSRGVMHRDIKPANVILGGYGETLVVDWGLAKLMGRAGAEGHAGRAAAAARARAPAASRRSPARRWARRST